MYEITIKNKASKVLANLPKKDYFKVREKIRDLANNPRPQGCLKLTGRNGWRIRIGVYRVIYQIHDKQLKILVLDIGHRRNIYK